MVDFRMTDWAKLRPPHGPRIWLLFAAGSTKPEIAPGLNISMRNVQRVCAELERKLLEELGGRGAESA
jgi:hypothetical protein